MIPGFRLLRRLVFIAVVLGGLFIAANIYLTHQAEKRIGAAIESNLGISGVQVSIDDFPLIAHLFGGTINKVTVSAHDVDVKGVEFATMQITLQELKINGGLLGGGKLAVTVGHGTLSATTTSASINAYLKSRAQRAKVALHPDRVVVTATRSIGGTDRRLVASGHFILLRAKQVIRFVATRVTVDGNTPTGSAADDAKRAATIDIALPRLPVGIKAEKISTQEGIETVSADFRDQELKIAG